MRPFKARLSGPAQQDIVDVLRYTLDQFGERQQDTYRDLIEEAIAAIEEEPRQAPSKQRDGLSEDAWVRPIRQPGKHARHILVYRITANGLIEVGRLLHDASDIERHLPEDYLR